MKKMQRGFAISLLFFSVSVLGLVALVFAAQKFNIVPNIHSELASVFNSSIKGNPLLEFDQMGRPSLRAEGTDKPDYSAKNQKTVPGEVIVKFKSAVDAENAKGLATASSHVGKILSKFKVKKGEKVFKNEKSGRLAQFAKFTSPDLNHEETANLISELAQDSSVESVEPNSIATAQWIPNDPFYVTTGSWGQSFKDLWGLYNSSLEKAWDISKGAGIVVAVIDTGVDYTHPDIKGNMWSNPKETCGNNIDDDVNGYVDDCNGWNFVSNTKDPMDDFGHGTHVAGTIAATGNNGVGMIGVAPEARIMALKSLNQYGSGNGDWLANAIYYAANNGARVINASWGGGGTAPQIFIDAIAYAKSKGSLFIAAAGNDGLDVGTLSAGFFPASIPDSMAIAAADHLDKKAWFSNYGMKLDITAPGGGANDPASGADAFRSVLSLLSSKAVPGMTGSGSFIIGGNLMRQAGTSMATPHAAGLAALIFSQHPEYTPEQVRQIMRLGTDDVETAGVDINSGYGRMNALKALQATGPLEVFISSPSTGQVITGKSSLTISGSAAGSGFSNYTVEQKLATATAWTQIASSNTAQTGGILGTWDLSAAQDGDYIIRVVTTNTSGTKYEYRTGIKIDNIYITSPDPFGVSAPAPKFNPYRTGDKINIIGNVTPALFTNYSIKIKNYLGSYLSNPNITLSGGGTQKIANGLLATWDTTGVPNDFYVIELTINAGGLSYNRVTRVLVDSTLHAGWPKENFSVINSSIMADLLGDGKKEIVVGFVDKVYAFRADGTQLAGWPVTIVDPKIPGNFENPLTFSSPVIGDLDGDSKPEVVVGAGSYIFMWHGDGTPVAGWPKSMGLGDSLSINDITGDGKNEILRMYGGRVNAVDIHGNTIWENCVGASFDPWTECNTPTSHIAVGDVTGDGKKDIVSSYERIGTDGNTVITVTDSVTRKAANGWPKVIINSQPRRNIGLSWPSLGDIDGDGLPDVVVGGSDGSLHVWHGNGTYVDGWPQKTDLGPGGDIRVLHTPAIGDIDGDGKNDIAAGSQWQFDPSNDSYNAIYAWKGDGTRLSGYPVKTYYRSCLTAMYIFGANVIIADVNGDKFGDVIATTDTTQCSPHAVHAFQKDGKEVPGFPMMTTATKLWEGNTPAIGDMNGDGKLQMTWLDLNGYMYLWDMPGEDSGVLPWPMFQHDAMMTASLLGKNLLGTTTFDILPPTAPDSFSATSTKTAISLSWASSTDNVLVTGYRIFRDNNPIDTTKNLSYTDNSMTVCAMHSYSIKAFDAVGNESQPSSLTQLISTIDCPDVIAPTAPSGLTALPEGYTKVNLKWNAATDNVGVVGYILSTPGTDIKLGNVLTHSLTVASCKTYNYYVKALDAAGNISMASNNFTTIMPCEPVVDTIPPTTPTNFTVISNIGTTANLTWTASTDNVAVTGYRVSRDGINIATTTNTSYADKTVSCTYYVYGIRAVDAAGNSSTEKTQTITTAGCPEVPDTVSPTVKITSPVNGQTIAAKGNLSVTVAASDNIGVSKVQIFLDNSLIVSDTSSPYSGNINVNKLTSGAHVLKAVAFDGAGNTSSSLITVSK